MNVKISHEQAAEIQKRLPEGRRWEDIRFMRVRAELLPPTPEDLRVAEEAHGNGAQPLLVDGRPNVMRVVSWFYHEGGNKNRFWFEADDLGESADRVRPPDLVPMDWNHSSIFTWRDEPPAIGVWYHAEKRWDVKAKEGQGAYGVQGFGVMWTWLFPDKANALLGMQTREGTVDFSVAVVPSSVSYKEIDGVMYEILHKPVILSHAALDVSPADEDAVGLVVDASQANDHTELQLRDQLDRPRAASHDGSEEAMTDEQKQAFEALEAKVAELEAKVAEQGTAATKMAELEGQLAEANTKADALVSELQGASTAMKDLQEKYDAAVQRLAEFEAREAAAAALATFEARFASLPETYRTAFDARPEEERARFTAKWSAADDADWADFHAEIAAAFQHARTNYTERSRAEGGALPNVGADTGIRELLRRT